MKAKNMNRFSSSPYGGQNWSQRVKFHRDEIGTIWTDAAVNTEWAPLRSILLHKPGPEIAAINDPRQFQMLEPLNYDLAVQQHDKLSVAFQELGVQVNYVKPNTKPSPNLMFCADLVFMTPEGAILGRPASTVRAGEERWMARRLAAIGIPILHTFTNQATFEGADALWIDPKTVLVGVGLRTNQEAVFQLESVLNQMEVKIIPVDLPVGTMHLMGILRFLDRKTAFSWPYRLPWKAYRTLTSYGYKVLYIPDEGEATISGALNFVTIEPNKILMADGNPKTVEFLETHGVSCQVVDVSEIHKAAGGIGCLTAVLSRSMI